MPLPKDELIRLEAGRKGLPNWYNWRNAHSEDPEVLRQVLLFAMEQGRTDETAAFAAASLHCPSDVLAQVVRSGREDTVAKNAVINRRCPPEVLAEVLDRGEESDMSWCASKNTSCPPEALERVLARGVDDYLSLGAASNPSCPPEALAKVLARGKKDDMSAEAARNPKCPLGAKMGWLAMFAPDPDMPDKDEPIMLEAASQPTGNVVPRLEAERICASSALPGPMWHGTMHDRLDAISTEGLHRFEVKQYRGDLGEGIYLTPDRNTARFFGDTVIELRVNVRNPFILDPETVTWYEDGDRWIAEAIVKRLETDAEFRQTVLEEFADEHGVAEGEVPGKDELDKFAVEWKLRDAPNFHDSIGMSAAVPPFMVMIGGKNYEFTGSDSGIIGDQGHFWEDVGEIAAEHGHDSVVSTMSAYSGGVLHEVLVFDPRSAYVVKESLATVVASLNLSNSRGLEKMASMKTWREIEGEQDQDGTKHDLRLVCVVCGNSQTCKCDKPKRVFEGVCMDCVAKAEKVLSGHTDIRIKTASADYSCVMMTGEGLKKLVKPMHEKIDKADLAPDGIEKDPHVSLLFGLHTTDHLDVMPFIPRGVSVELTGLSLFENDEHDVLKIDVESEALHKTNKKICEELDYTSDYDEYIPHVTIAYLKKGLGKKYVKMLEPLLRGDQGASRLPLQGEPVMVYLGKVFMSFPDKTGKENVEWKAGEQIVSCVCDQEVGKALAKLLRHISKTGAIGHSFEIQVDPGLAKPGDRRFGFDGDGSDRIDEDTIKVSKEDGKSKLSFSAQSDCIHGMAKMIDCIRGLLKKDAKVVVDSRNSEYAKEFTIPAGSIEKGSVKVCNREVSELKSAAISGKNWLERAASMVEEVGFLNRYLKEGYDPYDYSHLIERFLEEVGDDHPEWIVPGVDVEDDPTDWIEKAPEDAKTEFRKYVENRRRHSGDEWDAPPYETMSHEQFLKPGWMVHFTDDAKGIAAAGFMFGHRDMEGLALTNWKANRKTEPGYNFAFQADSRDAQFAAREKKYGRDAVVFWGAGVKAYHYGDEEHQVLVWGPSIRRDMIFAIFRDDDGWRVDGDTGRTLVRGEFEKCVSWVEGNWRTLADIKAKRSRPRQASKTYWGREGSGYLFVCPEDRTAMLLLRSGEVMEPGTWGIPGGAMAGTEGHYSAEEAGGSANPDDLRASAKAEVEQEIGFMPEVRRELGTTEYVDGGFRYVTFVAEVSAEEKRRMGKDTVLNWENDKAEWFPLSKLPEGLHHGVAAVTDQIRKMTGRPEEEPRAEAREIGELEKKTSSSLQKQAGAVSYHRIPGTGRTDGGHYFAFKFEYDSPQGKVVRWRANLKPYFGDSAENQDPDVFYGKVKGESGKMADFGWEAPTAGDIGVRPSSDKDSASAIVAEPPQELKAQTAPVQQELGFEVPPMPRQVTERMLGGRKPGVPKAKEITFPASEHGEVKARLDSEEGVHTTRVSSEQGRYHPGDIIRSVFGDLKVEEVRTFNRIEDHPFLSELTPSQRSQIENHGKFDVVRLTRVQGPQRLAKTADSDSIWTRKQAYCDESGCYDIDKLNDATANNQVVRLHVKNLVPMLFENAWGDKEHPLSPMAVLSDPAGNAQKIRHMSKIRVVDISKPILVRAGDGKLLDGYHRLAKAFLQEEERISAVMAQPEQMETAKLDLPEPKEADNE